MMITVEVELKEIITGNLVHCNLHKLMLDPQQVLVLNYNLHVILYPLQITWTQNRNSIGYVFGRVDAGGSHIELSADLLQQTSNRNHSILDITTNQKTYIAQVY